MLIKNKEYSSFSSFFGKGGVDVNVVINIHSDKMITYHHGYTGTPTDLFTLQH